MSKKHFTFLPRKLSVSALILSTLLAPLDFTVKPVQAGTSASANLNVSVRVISNAELQPEYQATHIRITGLDIARGFVNVTGATRFQARSGNHSGFRLEFYSVGHLFESVQIEGLTFPVQLGADGGSIMQRNAHSAIHTYSLNYRFRLQKETKAGEYPWPLQINAHPI
jgi:hypothetical protein